jgi:heme/copper-type cytochrome/quinol oxidase subunit 2
MLVCQVVRHFIDRYQTSLPERLVNSAVRRATMQFSPIRFCPAILALVVLAPVLLSQAETPPKTSDKNDKARKIQKINVVAERFNFTPSKIKVQQGTLLEINLTSDDTFHGFRIPSMQINQVIPARGRGSVKVLFDAQQKGTFAFECSRPCGAGHTMMRGVITVE